MGREVVGAPELESIQEAICTRFGTSVSPASIARALADHGVRLGHPAILRTDLRWRKCNLLFSAEDLTLDSLEAATNLVEKIESLRRQHENEPATLEHLFNEVRQIKSELQLIESHLAQELGQWLTIWLQNPGIFKEWLDLRRSTEQFRLQFGPPE